MRNRSIDSIVDHKSVVDLSIYRGGGLDPLHNWFWANSANLANNRSTKLGTLICSAHARTVRPAGADCPDRGPSGLRAGPSASSIFFRKESPQIGVSCSRTQETELQLRSQHKGGDRAVTQEPKLATQYKNKITRAQTQSYKNDSKTALGS
jgi:hypothetical protein